MSTKDAANKAICRGCAAWSVGIKRMEAEHLPADFLAWLRRASDDGRNDAFNIGNVPLLFDAFNAGKRSSSWNG